MSSVFDLLINEVANVLAIPPQEVKARFTEEQLQELLNSVWCEPYDELGIPIDSLDAPCDDLAVPNLLPPLEVNDLIDEISAKAKEKEKESPVKCIEKIDEINSIISKQIEDYRAHKDLLDKLIEYRDNFLPFSLYYKIRAEEGARILNEFQPLLRERNDLEIKIPQLREQRQILLNSISPQTPNEDEIRQQADAIQQQIDSAQDRISELEDIIEQNEESTFQTATGESLLNSEYLRDVLNYDSNSGQSFDYYVTRLFDYFITYEELSEYDRKVAEYSECIRCVTEINSISSLQELLQRSYFSFTLNFIQLNGINLEREKYDRTTDNRTIEKYVFPIRGNSLLQKNSFFQQESFFELNEFQVVPGVPVKGKIYSGYYNLFEDPINNFFSPDERGLTSTEGLVDPKLKGTGAERKRERNRDYYIRDVDAMQQFYQDFENRLENRKAERRKSVIEAEQQKLSIIFKRIAIKEVKLLFALARVNKYLPEQSQELQSAIDSFNRSNAEMLNKLYDLEQEITRLDVKAKELKPNPDKIKDLLKSKSPECFGNIDQPIADCGNVKNKLGKDPLFVSTINGIDPLLPTQNQLCYWREFSKIATLVGLLPIPNGPKVGQLRYWPIGLVIPTPATLVKIPLPIIWLPLVTISSPLGNIVFFLTVNGVFISPVVFLVSSSGFKQHIITVRGPSQKFGYTGEDELIKPSINLPISLRAAQSKAQRLSRESSDGPYAGFTDKEKEEIERQKTILKANEKSANKNNNENRKLKNDREKKNFNEATSGLTANEKLERTLNKIDSAKDLIADAKRAIFNRIEELGKPALTKSNEIKEKIISRREKLVSELQQALSQNDTDRASQIRQQLQSDAISLNEKMNAITSDLKSYYDRIKFPKVVIPKDASTIDPKQNAILEFLDIIKEFSSINGTQFFAKENSQVRSIFLKQVAKNKEKIAEEASKHTSGGYVDVENNPDGAKELLLKINETVVNAATGNGVTGNVAEQKEKIDDLKEKEAKETDKVKKIKLRKEVEKESVRLSEILENERTKKSLALTATVMASLSQIEIDFDPFAPCCNRDSFSLDLPTSPAIPIFLGAKATLDAAVSAMSVQDLKSLFGGKTKITPREITSGYLGMIKRSIPASLEIPLPDLNLASLASSFSGILLSLFEIKAPNLAAQPALPTSVTIDLNLLKGPLLSLLLGFLENCLPDKKDSPQSTAQSPGQVDSTPVQGSVSSSQTLATGQKVTSILSSEIEIVACDPSTTEESLLSDGTYDPLNAHSGRPDFTKQSNSSLFSGGSVIVNSKKDILPNFQTLESDFLTVNPGDLLAILKNFIDLKFSEVEKVLDPFYNLLSVVKSPKGVNLNLLESIQFKIPPAGPPAESLFFAITTAKKNAPRAANLRIVDVAGAKSRIAQLEPALKPISSSAPVLAAVAGAADAILPLIKVPKIDQQSGTVTTTDKRASSVALRSLHPLVSQDDLPPWERLSPNNILFALFLDEFVSSGADRVGFFRAYL